MTIASVGATETRSEICGIRTCLSLHSWEMQGDFDKMQGGHNRNTAKSQRISRGWTRLFRRKEQGKVIFDSRDLIPVGFGSRSPTHQGRTMSFVPNGYLSIREALNRLGRELFPAGWTGEEYKARRGLISEEEWLRIKDLPPPRGGGAQDRGPMMRSTPAAKPGLHSSGDPSDPSYQEEYRARQRHVDAQQRLRQLLEAGQLEAAILDPFTGALHQATTSLWRRHDADRLIEKGQAPIPRSRNTGSVLVKRFAESNVDTKPIPQAKIQEAIVALKEKLATESLTRSEQADFLRQTFSAYRITERQLRQIFRAVPMRTGRPRKSDA
jgi:hypothetical protein